MNFDQYKNQLKEISYGKRLPDSVYILEDYLADSNPELYNFLLPLKQNTIKHEDLASYNIIKLFKNDFKISFLSYPQFIEDPHPALYKSTTITLNTGKTRSFNYSKSQNPPILHRKETFIPETDPKYSYFKQLTVLEEAAGLYKNTRTIGFKKNWDELLANKNLKIEDNKLIKITQTLSIDKSISIDRHKTAITRYNFSRPVQSILEYNLLKNGETFFDYGCGLGDDIRGLCSNGFNANGWDPNHAADNKKIKSNIVNLGFVLNVIEDPAERINVLINSFQLAKDLLVVSTLITTSITAVNTRPYKDGIITSINTFQKYYDQNELQHLLEDVLGKTATPVAPGIFYVFKKSKELQTFLSNRSRRKINWQEISLKLYPNKSERQKIKDEQQYQNNKELLEDFWETMVELGRVPEEVEYNKIEEIKKITGSLNKARNMFIDRYGIDTLQETFQIRRNDILVYLALSNFKQKVPLKSLSTSLQRDIKTFAISYANGLKESRELLFSIGNPQLISKLCNETKMGLLDEQALYIHNSLLPKLDPILRIYIGCGSLLYGDINSADIIKIHKLSGKVTLLKYDDFSNKEEPILQMRIKVDLRNQKIDFFDHSRNNQELQNKQDYLTLLQIPN
jgi:DNA phosphorothioation-associated putative methyltransferase